MTIVGVRLITFVPSIGTNIIIEKSTAFSLMVFLACHDGMYGHNCSLKCPPFCANKGCDRVNGTCTECMSGHKGPTCEQKAYAYGKCVTVIVKIIL